MKKFLSLSAFVFFLGVLSYMFVSCGDDEENGSANAPDSTADLVGTWTSESEDFTVTYVFTQDQMTINNGMSEEFSGSYTYKDGIVSYKTTVREYNPDTQKNEEKVVTVNLRPQLLYDKNALVLMEKLDGQVTPSGEKIGEEYEIARVLYKQGRTLPLTARDIQGVWYLYLYGNKDYIRTAVTLNGDRFNLIITPWSQRYTGTFTYSNGYVEFKPERCYSARGEDGQGIGEGNLNPKTLEADWYEVEANPEFAPMAYRDGLKMQFLPNGKEAYGIIANIPGVFYKQ